MNPLGVLIAALLTLAAPHDYTVRHDVYADHDRGRADVYVPRADHPNAPLVVFVYGGSWDSGDRGFYRFVGASLASAGIVTVIPDYRVYPHARYPQFLRDNAEAVRWARDHAADWNADPRRMILMGHSAGAYNAVMLTVDGRWLAEVGMDAHRDIAGTVGLAGPYDFLPLGSAELSTIFGPPEEQPATQPINHIDGRNPPLLLLHGAADTEVYPRNSTRMGAAVSDGGGDVRVIIYPRLDHAGLLGAVMPQRRRASTVFSDLLAFIRGVTAARHMDQAA